MKHTSLMVFTILLFSSCGVPHWSPCKSLTDQTISDYGKPSSIVFLSSPKEYVEPGSIYYYYNKGFAKVFDVSIANDGHSECHDHIIVTDAARFLYYCKRSECVQSVIDIM